MKKKYILLGSVLVSGLLLSAINFTRPGCDFIQGHWAGARSFCYTRLCYFFGDCGGPWVVPAAQCIEIQQDTSEAMLHFYLGNPERKSETRIFWPTGKDGQIIEATVENGKLSHLKCPE